MFDFGIIGGGASGMYASILLAKKGYKVALFEANERVGKKLLATGNGKCNLSNVKIDDSFYNTSEIKDIVEAFDMQRQMADLGLITKIKSGRIYPLSEQSNNVLNVLLCNLNHFGVSVFTNHLVREIKITNCAVVVTDTQMFECKKVCLATGSNAGFGEESIDLYQKFGHTSTKRKASLVPLLATNPEQIKGLCGVRQEAMVSLICDGKMIAKEFGEVQFRKDGISGIVILNHSARMCHNELDRATCYLDFMPDFAEEEVEKLLKNKITAQFGLLNKNLMQNAVKQGVKGIKNYKIDVARCNSFKQAQVVNGGLTLSQFDLMTMRSKLQSNLFAIGEALDVDGLCGGYNLHFAFASAYNFAKEF